MDNPFVTPSLMDGIQESTHQFDGGEALTENPFMGTTGERVTPDTNPFLQSGATSDRDWMKQKALEAANSNIDFVNSSDFTNRWQGAKRDEAHQKELDDMNMPWLASVGKSFKDTATPEGLTSAATTVGNFLTSAVGMPLSWAHGLDTWEKTGNKDAALAAIEATKEWLDVKSVLKYYGVDDKYLESPNFLDDAFDSLNKHVVQPGADKYFGDKDSALKSVYTDIINTAIFAGAAKGVDTLRPSVKIKPTAQSSSDVEAGNLKGRNPVFNPAGDDAPLNNVFGHWENGKFVFDEDNLDPHRPIDINKYDVPPPTGPAKAPDNPQRVPFVDRPEEPDLGPRRDEPLPDQKSSGLPVLEDYPAPFMDQLGPDVDTRGKMHNPFLSNVVDQDAAQAHPDVGAHSTMDFRTEGQEPSQPDATKSYDSGVAQDIDNKRALQGSTQGVFKDFQGYGPRAADFQMINEHPKFGDFINARTLEDALQIVAKHGKDVDQSLAKIILKNKGLDNKTIPFDPNFQHHARGFTGVTKEGGSIVGWNPEHASLTTVLHEAVHVHTNDALYAFEVGTANPKQRTYGERLNRLYNIARKEVLENGVIPDEYKQMFENLREFNAYGLTDPLMQTLLHSIPLKDSLNGFSKFVQIIKDFFGSKDNAFTELVKATREWPDIQTADRSKFYQDVMQVHQGKDKINYERLSADRKDYYYENARDALSAAKGKDLNGFVPNNFITPNQVAALSDHPVIHFFMDKMGQITRQASPRFHQYARDLAPFMFDRKTKLERSDLVASFKTLVDIQDPALKGQRADAERFSSREQFLKDKGLSDAQVKFATKVLDIMQDVHKKDIEGVARLGRKLDYEPMYFPRVHGGRFVLKILDANGLEQYVKGFDSYKEAQIKSADLKQKLKDRDDLKIQNIEQTNRGNFGDDFAMLLLEHEIPMEFLDKGMQSIQKARETAPFAFEKARRGSNVGGYTGEDIGTHAEEEKLLKVLSWRLQASRNLETKSRMLSEIKFPLFDGAALGEMPRARLTVGNLLNRELGTDISKTKGPDAVLQGIAETVAKGLAAVGHFEQKFIRGQDMGDFRWDQPRVREDLAKHLARQLTYVASMMKLSLNIPVYTTNFATNALIGMHGLRQASLDGVSHGHALSALFKTWFYTGVDKDAAKSFMVQARNEGMVETKGQEHYTTAEIPDRGTLDRVLQAPRDKIEEMTNYASILYYYHFYKSARPDLEGEALKAKVYRAVKTFTGQYESYAGPLMFDKAGTTGQLFTNFAKWHFNQLGMELVDAKKLGTERMVLPMLMTVAMAGLTAGAYGLPAVVEYEAIRRMGTSIGAWDLPPISGLRSKITNHVPYWDFFERGAITAGTESLAKLLGANSGPDVSGSMRYSAFFDAPTVAIQTLWQILGKALPTVSKELGTLVGGAGAHAKEIEDAFKAFPQFMQDGVKKGYDYAHPPGFFKEKIKTADGQVLWRVKDPSDNNRQLYTQSDIENTYNLLGMKSQHEAKALEAIYYDKWQQREDQRDIKDYTQGIMSHMGDNRVFRQNIINLLRVGGQAAAEAVLPQLEKRITAAQFDYFTAEYQKLMQTSDAVQAQKMYQRIQTTRMMAK